MGGGGAISCALVLTADVPVAAPISLPLTGSGGAARLDSVGDDFCSGRATIGVFEIAKSALLARASSFSLGNTGLSRNWPFFNVCCTSETSASDMNGLGIVATTFGNLPATAVISCT